MTAKKLSPVRQFISKVLRERALIATIVTGVVVEVAEDIDDPSVTWKGIVLGILAGLVVRLKTTPWPLDQQTRTQAGVVNKK